MNNAKFFTSERLRELRAEKKINGRKRSQAAAAAVFGVSDRTYKAWETGRSLPDTESLLKIAAEYGVSCDYLLGLVETRTPGVPEFVSMTGLSPRAIDVLCDIQKKHWIVSVSQILSAFLEHDARDFGHICAHFERYCEALSEVENPEDDFARLDVAERLNASLFTCSQYLARLFDRTSRATHRSKSQGARQQLPEGKTGPS